MKQTHQRTCGKEVIRDLRIEKSYQIIFANGQNNVSHQKTCKFDSVAGSLETTCMLERSNNYGLSYMGQVRDVYV